MRMPSVRRSIRPAVLFALALVGAFALAAPLPATAQDIRQIRLTDKQVQNYIAAQKDMNAIAEKLNEGDPEKVDPKLTRALEDTAKKHGFASFEDYDVVAANISLVAAGLDPEKKTFVEPAELIRQEIAAVKADKKLTKAQKDEALKALDEGLKSAKPLQFRENIALVQKYYDKLDLGMPEGEAGEGRDAE